MQRYQQDGAVATSREIDSFSALLGRAPRSYRDFAQATATAWTSN